MPAGRRAGGCSRVSRYPMTALQLLLWINASLALQALAFGSVAFYRYSRAYRALRRRAADHGVSEADLSIATPPMPKSGPAWSGFREFVVQRKELEDPSGSVCSFYLAPADSRPLPTFHPGQFLTLRIDPGGQGQDRMPVIRCYSLSDRPQTDLYRISIKRALPPPNCSLTPPGVASNHLHDGVKVGDRLSVRAPSGHFYLDDGAGPIVLIAGGIGITPLLSMMNAALHAEPTREVWLFYGVRSGAEHAMKAHLSAMAAQYPSLHLHVCYSRPDPGDVADRDFHHRGHVDLALLRTTLPLRPFQFYVCGPRQMMETLVPSLQDWGVPPSRIHYEAFGPASLARRERAGEGADQETKPLTVTFRRSGTQALWDGRASSLLEFAESLGVKVESGCRAGSCGSCQVTLEAGEVQYDQLPDFDPNPGDCLLCISRPRTDVVLQA